MRNGGLLMKIIFTDPMVLFFKTTYLYPASVFSAYADN